MTYIKQTSTFCRFFEFCSSWEVTEIRFAGPSEQAETVYAKANQGQNHTCSLAWLLRARIRNESAKSSSPTLNQCQ